MKWQGGIRVEDPTAEKRSPGLQVESTSEFSLFFRVKPGHQERSPPGAAGAERLAGLPAGRLRPAGGDHP